MTEHDSAEDRLAPTSETQAKPWDGELDLIVELEGLAATESERFLELERLQGLSAEDMAACLARLQRAIPLRRLSRVCQDVLRERAAFVDVDYLRTRSAEVIARDSGMVPHVAWVEDYPSDPDWVGRCVHEALSDVLLEDEELFADGEGPAQGEDFHHQGLVHCYGVEPRATLEASVAFHRLPDKTRHAFFALLVDKHSVERCVAMGLGPGFRLRDEVRGALDTLLGLQGRGTSTRAFSQDEEGRDHVDF